MTGSAAEIALLLAALLAGGAFVGVLAGMFGVGGGAVLVPILYELFRMLGVDEAVRMPLCVGTSLAVIIPTSIRSYLGHRAKGAVDMDVLKGWAVPVVIGVVVGSAFARYAPPYVFQIVFVAVASANAIKLFFGRDSWRVADDLPQGPLMRVYGLAIGLISALMGIGGGQVSNLIMNFHGRPIHQSVATSSGLGVLISIPGTIGYMIAGWPKMAQMPPLSLGFVSLIGAAALIPTSVWLAPAGVRLAHAMPKRSLEIAFACFLTLVAARFLYALLSRLAG
jgi:uncharacterized membrane protein YfcA